MRSVLGCRPAAMVLRKLFEELLRHGTVVAFTSNQPPDALYQVRTRVLV